MSFTFDPNIELKPKIVVLGVGGAGGNAVNNMINSGLEGVEFWMANTDAQALKTSTAQNKIQLGTSSTKGLGAGSNPEVGRMAAEESIEQIEAALEGCHMAFITAGMGGGTGTGAAPVIATLAKEKGILTVGVVTKPFHFEGARRMKIGELGLEEMSKNIDTLIVIPNQNLFHIANEKTTFADAFKMADTVLDSGIRGITDLITMPGIINLDFADIRTVMNEMGKAMMGTGDAEGDNRATKAAEAAISNPLLDNSSMRGARGVLINITGAFDMTLYEVDEAANRIKEEVDPNANIIFGSVFNPEFEGRIRVSVVATGIDAHIPQNQNVGYHQSPEHKSTPMSEDPRTRNSPYAALQNNITAHTPQQTFSTQMHEEPRRRERPLVTKDNLQDANKGPSFVPPKPYEVRDNYDVRTYDNYDDRNPTIQHSEEYKGDNHSSFSNITSRASDIKRNEQTRSDFLDIPAILRRGNNENDNRS